MDIKVLDLLPFELDESSLIQRLKLTDELQEEFHDLLVDASAIARPKLIYGCAAVTRLEQDAVQVGDMRFVSRVLYVNMEGVDRAFPYVATCGRELYDLAESKTDPLEKYWVNAIAEAVLYSGLSSALDSIRENEGTGTLYAMNPGSLPDWPISEQRPLFRLLGDVMDTIGVELTESFLMLPVKSVSGLMFESKTHYTNCALCPRDGCPNRREPFSAELFYEKYRLDA